MWTEIQFVDDNRKESEMEDGFTAVHLFMQEREHHTLPAEGSVTAMLGTWPQIQADFMVDFPRFTLFLDGARVQDPKLCIDALRRRVGEEKMRELVGLCTQGALAQAYAALSALHPPPAHVLSAGVDVAGARPHRVHIWLDACSARVQHMRSFVLACIDSCGDMKTNARLEMELHLHPRRESLMVVERQKQAEEH